MKYKMRQNADNANPMCIMLRYCAKNTKHVAAGIVQSAKKQTRGTNKLKPGRVGGEPHVLQNASPLCFKSVVGDGCGFDMDGNAISKA